MNPKFLTAGLLLSLMFGTGCVRRTVSQDFGLTSIAAPAHPKCQVTHPDASLRAIFKQQTQGAFDPLSDDPHVQELQARLKANSQDVEALLGLGAAYESYRLYNNAFPRYLEATRLLAPDNAAAEQAAFGLARSARASHQPDEAVTFLERVVQHRPSANSWNELGLLYEEVHAPLTAESAFERAIAAKPESDSLHNNLGYSLLVQNRIQEAEAEFHKALALNPASATARNNLATALARRGDLEEALKQFQLTSDAATAHNNLAVVLLEMQQYEQSREQLVKALAIRRYFAPALANFKLVQERIREEAEVRKYGRLPLSTIRVPSALVALAETTIAPEQFAKDLEDKQ